jgi:copper chaperone NosL
MMMRMPRLSRVLILIASLLLGSVLLLPLWRISLLAPQYPEGLGMSIRPSTVVGAKPHDLDNINSLNHYIGMRPIDPDTIPELRYMPWIIVGLALFGLTVAAIGRKRPVVAWVGAFAALGAAGMYDFWRWGYDYGHNLDSEHAIIKIPGMTYQPPLVGTKQLLNFTATSLPDVGGVVLGVAFVLGVVALFLAFRSAPSAPAPST